MQTGSHNLLTQKAAHSVLRCFRRASLQLLRVHPQIALADPPFPDEASARMTDRIDDDLPAHTVESTLASFARPAPTHAPRVLVLYGSLREKSFSRYLALECERVLTRFGA